MAILTLAGSITVVQPYLLSFTSEPVDTVVTEDQVISPAIVVRVADIDVPGVALASYTGAITLYTETIEGILFGTLTRNAVAGVATFDDIGISQSGVYSIWCSLDDENADPVESEAFTVLSAALPIPSRPLQLSLANPVFSLARESWALELDQNDAKVEVRTP